MNSHRIKLDIMKLVSKMYETTVSDDMRFISVQFHGPNGTPYEHGVWDVHVYLPESYPFQSPSVGFERNSIMHPNVDWVSGSICLDAINHKWTAMYDLSNIFDTFLPHLLRYPNPKDPLNMSAAQIMLKDAHKFQHEVRRCVRSYMHRRNGKVRQTGETIAPEKRSRDGQQTDAIRSSILVHHTDAKTDEENDSLSDLSECDDDDGVEDQAKGTSSPPAHHYESMEL